MILLLVSPFNVAHVISDVTPVWITPVWITPVWITPVSTITSCGVCVNEHPARRKGTQEERITRLFFMWFGGKNKYFLTYYIYYYINVNSIFLSLIREHDPLFFWDFFDEEIWHNTCFFFGEYGRYFDLVWTKFVMSQDIFHSISTIY